MSVFNNTYVKSASEKHESRAGTGEGDTTWWKILYDEMRMLGASRLICGHVTEAEL